MKMSWTITPTASGLGMIMHLDKETQAAMERLTKVLKAPDDTGLCALLESAASEIEYLWETVIKEG
jgi:hypothetical protein